MSHVNMKPWRISKDRILQIAKSKGRFEVPRFLYRAEAMRIKCSQMVKDGQLHRIRSHDRRTLVFVPINQLR